MPNPFFTNTINLIAGQRIRAGDLETDFSAIETGFDNVSVALELKAPKIAPAFIGGTVSTPPANAMGGEIINAAWARALALSAVSSAEPGMDGLFLFTPNYVDNVLVRGGATYLKTGVVAGGAAYPQAERIYHQTIAAITAPPATYAVARGASSGTRFVFGRSASTTVDIWDGANWSTGTLAHTPTGVPGIAWDSVNSLFVAVGGIAAGSSNAGTSPDGGAWTLRAMPSSANWSNAVFAGGGRVIAFVQSTAQAAYSANGGITWNAATLPSSAAWTTGGYAANTHLIVAGNTTSGARSTDGGQTWAALTLPATFTQVFGVNDHFVGYNGATSYVSADGGQTWTTVALPLAPNALGGITYANGVYVLTGNSANTFTANSLLPDPGSGRLPWGIARTVAQNVNQTVAGALSVLTLQNTGPSASNLALDVNGFVGSVTNSTASLGGLGTSNYYKRVA